MAQMAQMPDPFQGRAPTSHERMTGQPWDASYRDGPAPWDTERPQPALVRVAASGAIRGPVLDAGCGAGENALHIAALGLEVFGFDVAETAVSIARARAESRGVSAQFATKDALALQNLGRTFRTVLDCGLFHTFDDDEQRSYATSLAAVTEDGGTLCLLCFRDDGPGTGPHPVSPEQLHQAFNHTTGWEIETIEPERVQTRFHDENGAPAWLATVRRYHTG